MATTTYEIEASDAVSEADVSKVDLKLESLLFPSRMSIARKNSIPDSGGDSMPTTTTARIIA